ncbi:hypothetical protein PoB_002765700 [Plakobranchus ocellatus]|uniref:EF-hand domain-containing protein n=1 Tax=Plakobranchus ocellatus TaxID=259542 RepID=A0AAV4A2Q0_9GAST|nr:hypothetical protein PoB_002765700 [Plakobranchus ocellatus]
MRSASASMIESIKMRLIILYSLHAIRYNSEIHVLASKLEAFDNQVSREEFLDYYSQLYNISSELATIMFDYLNDPASRDDVITTSDVTLSSFAGRMVTPVSGEIVLNADVSACTRERAIDYDSFLTSIDTNKDKIVSITELNHELKRFNPNQPASRTDWVWRNSQRYGAKYPDVSSLAFDFFDRDGDLKLTSRDLQMLAENLDYNAVQAQVKSMFLIVPEANDYLNNANFNRRRSDKERRDITLHGEGEY